ncbi:hypothetical protein Hanom_Chr02g00123131 [Helianthus anomalus]
MSTPTSGRSLVGETKLLSGNPFRRPMVSQAVVPQNNSSPPFTSSSFFPVSVDISDHPIDLTAQLI